MLIRFIWFYTFEYRYILPPWDCTDPWNFTVNIINWFLFDKFFMIYDNILFFLG